jgi:hypothetical protein
MCWAIFLAIYSQTHLVALYLEDGKTNVALKDFADSAAQRSLQKFRHLSFE